MLKHPSIERIDLVDLDPRVTELFSSHEMLTPINQGSLTDARVHVHNQDAQRFMEESDGRWDVVIMDLPDPSDVSIGKLYSRAFFRLVGQHLGPGGVMVTQATSPFRSRLAFWGINATLEATTVREGEADLRFSTAPYHTYIPTFGTWGFVMARLGRPVEREKLKVSVDTRYLTDAVLPGLFVFPPDIARVEAPVTDLDSPSVVTLYQRGYHEYLD